MSGLIPLLKLIIDSGAFSPSAPPEITPPSSKAGMRPNCGLGSDAKLINDKWVCVPSFK